MEKLQKKEKKSKYDTSLSDPQGHVLQIVEYKSATFLLTKSYPELVHMTNNLLLKWPLTLFCLGLNHVKSN
jgi:hypothetical protein